MEDLIERAGSFSKRDRNRILAFEPKALCPMLEINSRQKKNQQITFEQFGHMTNAICFSIRDFEPISSTHF